MIIESKITVTCPECGKSFHIAKNMPIEDFTCFIPTHKELGSSAICSGSGTWEIAS